MFIFNKTLPHVENGDDVAAYFILKSLKCEHYFLSMCKHAGGVKKKTWSNADVLKSDIMSHAFSKGDKVYCLLQIKLYKLNFTQLFILISVQILATEYQHCIQICRSLPQREFAISGSIAVASAFATYMGPYDPKFRRAMLTVHWPLCLQERGVPLVIDSIDPIKGK